MAQHCPSALSWRYLRQEELELGHGSILKVRLRPCSLHQLAVSQIASITALLATLRHLIGDDAIVGVALDVDERACEDEEAAALHGAQEGHDQLLVNALSLLGRSLAKATVLQLLKLILQLVQLHELILKVLQRLHLVANEEAVAERQHPKVHSVEAESLSPLPADWRGQLRLQGGDLAQQVVDLVVKHILLLLPLAVRASWACSSLTLVLHLLCLMELEELLDL